MWTTTGQAVWLLMASSPRQGGATSDSHTLFQFEASFWLGERLLQLWVNSVQASG